MNAVPLKRARGRPKKTESEKDDGNRRQALIAAAGYLFKTQGFDATSTREIASRVGMQAGSPFYHFNNKQDLLMAVIVEGLQQAIASQHMALLLAQEAEPDMTERQRLGVLIRHHLDVLFGPHSDFIGVMLYEARSLTPAHRLRVNELSDAYEAAWIPVLEQLSQQGQLAAPVKAARLLIFGALNWTVQWFDMPRSGVRSKDTQRLGLDELADAAIQLFLKPV
jgi:AcrR family transcriptional regulator